MLLEREAMTYRIRVLDRQTGNEKIIAFASETAMAGLHANPNIDGGVLRYWASSLTEPRAVFEYDLATGAQSRTAELLVSKGYDSAAYQSERKWFIAGDGTKVPVSLVYRVGQDTSSSPLMVSAYGAYGISSSTEFDSARVSLLDRGFVYAIIHVRGGGELGSAWHRAGSLTAKKNTFTDFIEGTDFLLDQGYGDPQKVFARGRSAGGLIMGYIANRAANRYRGIIAEMPFVDVLGSVSVPIPVAVSGVGAVQREEQSGWDLQEWGDPSDPEVFSGINAWSPYAQVERQAYPAIFMTTALHDARVPFYQPLKWLNKLRKFNSGTNRIIIDIAMNTGHRGPSDRYDYHRLKAMEYAFIINELARDSANLLR